MGCKGRNLSLTVTANVDCHIFAWNRVSKHGVEPTSDPRLKRQSTSTCEESKDFVPRSFVDRIIQCRFGVMPGRKLSQRTLLPCKKATPSRRISPKSLNPFFFAFDYACRVYFRDKIPFRGTPYRRVQKPRFPYPCRGMEPRVRDYSHAASNHRKAEHGTGQFPLSHSMVHQTL
jgi:hypothetical protein